MNAETTKLHWKKAAGSYDTRITSDLDDPKLRKAWMKILTEGVPDGDGLQILDVGTGPGFFSVLLSEAGHHVTGIDCTEDMIRKARKNAEYWHADANYLVMDAEHPDFPDNTFDVIVSRNVTWTLLDPFHTYREWRRILKPGGRLLIFDGNWYWNLFDRDTFEEMERRTDRYMEMYGEFPAHFSMNVITDYMRGLPLVGVRRPDWDRATLWKLDYSRIRARWLTDEETERSEDDRMLYGAVPMFMILADKPAKERNSAERPMYLWEMEA